MREKVERGEERVERVGEKERKGREGGGGER